MNKTEVKQTEKKLVQIQYIPINLLKEWNRNPRRNVPAIDKLSKLIEAHGFINPVIATNDNIIRAGHTRVKAAKKAGLKEVPVIFIDMDDKQAQAYAIADNKSNTWTEWDFSLLKDVLLDLDSGDFDMDLAGFDLEEIENLMTWTHDPEGNGQGSGNGDLNPELAKKLVDKFIIPPFSILNTRQGYWQDRKRQWLSLGIKSELGRGGAASTSARSNNPTYREISR